MGAYQFVAVASLVFFSLLTSCASEPAAERYDVRGEVAGVAPDRLGVALDHEEIVGYMSAMTMSFRVRDAAMLENIALGDQVRAVLEVGEEGPVITEITKVE